MKRTWKQRAKCMAAAAMAAMMVMGSSAVTMAAPVTVTISNDALLTGHTFEAYQVFSGTQAKDETGNIISAELGDVHWGDGINGEAFLAELKGNDAPAALKGKFTTCEDAATVAKELGKYANKSDVANAFAKLAYKHKSTNKTSLTSSTTTLAEGYYLIVDTTVTNGEDKVKNAALLQVTGKDAITIEVKTDKPTVDKQVTENSDTDLNNSAADYNIGDDVPFTFESHVPDMSNYDTYKFIFHDTMSSGLDFKADSVVFKIGEKTLTQGTDYTVVTEDTTDGCTFEIVINDLKKYCADNKITDGAEIKVTYTATLNSSAEIGNDGNTNTVVLEYSNNPNDTNETGKTPGDKVVVFTYELDVDKVDGATLDKDGNVVEDETEHLKDAEFKLYRKVTKDVDDTEVEEYVKVDTNGKVKDWVNEDNASVLTTDEDGNFKIIGLDAGVYYLKETKAPAGYNVLKNPIKLVVTATIDDKQGNTDKELTELEVVVGEGDDDDEDTVEGNTTTGSVEIVVANNKGVLLPETGGAGTTVLYVVGILAMAGGVFYFTMRRKKNHN